MNFLHRKFIIENFANFSVYARDLKKITNVDTFLRQILSNVTVHNAIPLGNITTTKDWFSCNDVYWKQTDRQTDRQEK